MYATPNKREKPVKLPKPHLTLVILTVILLLVRRGPAAHLSRVNSAAASDGFLLH